MRPNATQIYCSVKLLFEGGIFVCLVFMCLYMYDSKLALKEISDSIDRLGIHLGSINKSIAQVLKEIGNIRNAIEV